jgi:hypothetical protein
MTDREKMIELLFEGEWLNRDITMALFEDIRQCQENIKRLNSLTIEDKDLTLKDYKLDHYQRRIDRLTKILGINNGYL